MNTTKVIGDLTQAHIDQLATRAAEAHLERAGLVKQLAMLKARSARISAAFEKFNMTVSESGKTVRRNGIGVAWYHDTRFDTKGAWWDGDTLAIALATASRRNGYAIQSANDAIRWNNLDISPIVSTDFCDRNSATKIDFGY